jgi:chemotaxis protein methyltransferase CheR
MITKKNNFTNRTPYTHKYDVTGKQDDPFYEFKQKMNKFYENPLNGEKYFKLIIDHISKLSKIDLTLYRDSFLHRRIYNRVTTRNALNYSKYYELLKTDNEEVAKFVEAFTIHVTEFFRDTTPFTYLETKLLPEIIEKKKKSLKAKDRNTLRILSAPCSTGEEPYSIAMIIEKLRKKKVIPKGMEVQIYASDINQAVINKAKKGTYHKDTLKKVPSEIISRHFRMVDETNYQIDRSVGNDITWILHDLLKPLPVKQFDLVLCRNFLIYISKDSKDIAINNIVDAMKDGAYLMLGKTEGFPFINTKQFKSESIREHIYQLLPRINQEEVI